uniref:Uncharacterized protein n=1 Tax=Glycine max TaxID=3847 RepID=C6TJX4_SOYBN|nr:unknown [Glycine max]
MSLVLRTAIYIFSANSSRCNAVILISFSMTYPLYQSNETCIVCFNLNMINIPNHNNLIQLP